MRCHTVPTLTDAIKGSLKDDYAVMVHFILDHEKGAEMVIAKKNSDGSILVLRNDESDRSGSLSVWYSSESEDSEHKKVTDEVKNLAKLMGLTLEPWEDHKVYEFIKAGEFAIHSLNQPGAKIVRVGDSEPALRFLERFYAFMSGK